MYRRVFTAFFEKNAAFIRLNGVKMVLLDDSGTEKGESHVGKNCGR
jgi:hypothetical protein